MKKYSITTELESWGPESKVTNCSPLDANNYTRWMATSHYENFPVLSWAMPKHLRQHIANVYAFCRWADDLGDEIGSPERSLHLLDWWQEELNLCYQGQLRHPIFVALSPTIEQFSLPQSYFEDLISAFKLDQSVRQYETKQQLLDYCRRSANPVGRIVLMLFDHQSSENDSYSDSICTGLQLANFWQDVACDYEIGRVYLPAQERNRFGYSDEELSQKIATESFRALMKAEVEDARASLIAGSPLIESVSGRLKIVLSMFLRGGLEILDLIQRRNFDVWSHRPTISKVRFASIAAKSLFLPRVHQ